MIASILLLALCSPPKLSAAAMKADLAQIETTLDEVHPNPFFQLPRVVFHKKAEAIIRHYPHGATRKQFYVASASLVAELGDGHTRITPATPDYVKFRMEAVCFFRLNSPCGTKEYRLQRITALAARLSGQR